MAIIDGHIRCSGCGEMKALDAFAPSFAKRGRGRCRPCNIHNCNYGIGALGDTIEGVRRALNYLERAQQPLSRVAPTMRINLMQGVN